MTRHPERPPRAGGKEHPRPAHPKRKKPAFLPAVIHDLIGGARLAEKDVEARWRQTLRGRIALGILFLSVLSAVAGWRASALNEAASNQGAAAYQDFVQQLQAQRQTEASVTRDLTQYGSFEQQWLVTHMLSHEAQARRAPRALYGLAQQQSVALAEMTDEFEFPTALKTAGDAVQYRPGVAYGLASEASGLSGPRTAFVSQPSGDFGQRALDMTRAALLSVAALVLLTFGQVTLRRPRRRLSIRDREVAWWSVAHTFAVAAGGVAMVALALFLLALLQ